MPELIEVNSERKGVIDGRREGEREWRGREGGRRAPHTNGPLFLDSHDVTGYNPGCFRGLYKNMSSSIWVRLGSWRGGLMAELVLHDGKPSHVVQMRQRQDRNVMEDGMSGDGGAETDSSGHMGYRAISRPGAA